MTSTIIANLQNYYASAQQEPNNSSSYCTLKWRRGQLIVQSIGQNKQPYLATLDTHESLVECLKHSSVHLVRIDTKLGEAKLRLWANACEEAQKPLFLTISNNHSLSKQNLVLAKWLRFVLNSIVAFIVLLAASPILLGLMAIIRMYSSESLFSREWYVGERGRLFRAIKFRTAFAENTNAPSSKVIARWMRKSGLDHLPLLFNVLRGEMNLTGRRNWKLEDTLRLSTTEQKQLNQIPGIASLWQIETETETNILHLDSQTM
ncbi:sugar transferase [Calothrix sp. NIES-4101]|nr:sugar transferase [Calothrix sp. NIES-4101]